MSQIRVRKEKCAECGIELSPQVMLGHSHLFRTVSRKSAVYVIRLPDGYTPGRWEAAEYFAQAVDDLHSTFPGKSFTYTPFDHEQSVSNGGVTAWLAIGT